MCLLSYSGHLWNNVCLDCNQNPSSLCIIWNSKLVVVLSSNAHLRDSLQSLHARVDSYCFWFARKWSFYISRSTRTRRLKKTWASSLVYAPMLLSRGWQRRSLCLLLPRTPALARTPARRHGDRFGPRQSGTFVSLRHYFAGIGANTVSK